MAFYQFIRTQKLPIRLELIWDFITSPLNLKEITPQHLGFEVTNNSFVEKMYPGMIITYKVSPILGIKLNWMTEITHIKELEYFVDEQRMGPYVMWHHQHKVAAIESGIIMTDIVTYQPPFGFIGALANRLFIKNQLNQIFDYRKMALENRFGIY